MPDQQQAMVGNGDAGAKCSYTIVRDVSLKQCCFTGLGINVAFPDDLLLEIFYRLPCLSAVKCKSVCKRWLSLISTFGFINCFITRNMKNHHPQDPILKSWGCYLFITSQAPNFHLPFSFLPGIKESTEYQVKILASSNDMLLCSMGNKLHCTTYIIYNPFTRHFVQLPPAPSSQDLMRFGFIYKPYHCVGNDKQNQLLNSNTDFIIVRLKVILRVASEFELDIFSSKTWQWTKAIMQSPKGCYSLTRVSCSAVSHRGLLYWLVGSGEVIVHDPYNNKVCYVIDPPEGEMGRFAFKFSICCGSLLVYEFEGWVFRFWELENWDRPKWRLDCVVALNEYIVNAPEMLAWARPEEFRSYVSMLAFHPNDRDIIYLRSHFEGFGTCNLRTKTFKRESVSEFSRIHYKRDRGRGVVELEHRFAGDVFVVDAPCWPTPVPALLDQFVHATPSSVDGALGDNSYQFFS